jgi:hypothetical protein
VVAALPLAWSVAAQEDPPAANEPPSLAVLEEQLEQVFAAAVEFSDRDDVEPMHVLQSWGTVMMSATVLEHRRAQETGRATDAERAQETLLERWQDLRPDSAGPELFRLFRIQDQAERLPGLLELVARHPDDPLVLAPTGMALRSFGQAERATELLEAHAQSHPSRGMAWRLLAEHYGSLQNETRQMAALAHWAEVDPDDPALIDAWTGAGLDRVDPEGTARLLGRFLDHPHDDSRALETCARLARAADGPHRSAARRCVARFAADSREDETSVQARQRAVGVLAELAAQEGDWAGLLDSLEALEPAGRSRALVASAYRVDAPGSCSQRIELLRAALPDAGADGSTRSSIATAARACEQRPAAQALFLDLLSTAPLDEVPGVVGAWAQRVNGVLRGEVPAGAAALLEARLQREPEAGELYRALDTVYELEGEGERRFELLRRWRESAPDSMRGQQAIALAEELMFRGDPGEAIALLEARLARGFSQEEAELLWQLYAEPELPDDAEWPDEAAWREGIARADRYAGDLIASGEPYRAAFGHLLTARGAVLRDDAAAAERHYLEAMRVVEHPRDEWVTEMLEALSASAEAPRLAELALLVCEQSALAQRHRGQSACATALLSRSGQTEAIAEIAEVAGDLPDDEGSLTSLAFGTQEADPELAERAWRKLLAIDPMDAGAWSNFAAFLFKQGRPDEVEALLPEIRHRFASLPVHLLQTVGRARIALGRPEEAIEILEEARAALSPRGNPAWIDADLREAYAAIGRRERAAAASRSGNTATASSTRPLSAEEAAALEADLAGREAHALIAAGEALRSGIGGRYDPRAAIRLFERAAAAGDTLASYRVAILRRLGADAVDATTLAAVATRAEQGDSYARYLTGTGALLGVGRERDSALARRWLELAAEPEGPPGRGPQPWVSWAHHNLAWMAETGEDLDEPDLAAALDGYSRAGVLGNVASLYDFARLALSRDDDALCREGLARLERAATAGHAAAAAFLGKVRFHGPAQLGSGRVCVVPDPEGARPWLERAAESGDLGAKYDLGLLLLLSGQEAEAKPALAMLREVAEAPSALAIEVLHLVRATGVFAPRDPAHARAWRAEAVRFGSGGLAHLRRETVYAPGRRLLEEARLRLERLVAEGDREARPLLAAILLEGPYDLRDPERGARLAREAAAAGDGWGARLLAGALEEGNGVEADPREALRFMRVAAEAGDPFAMFDLSVELMSGERLELDLEAGAQWLTRAAEAGHWPAIGELARLYVEGRPGVEPRPELAAPWMIRRAELGDDQARGWLIVHGHQPP